MLTLIKAFIVVALVIGALAGGVSIVGKIFAWLCRVAFELGKIVFVFFIIWLILVLL